MLFEIGIFQRLVVSKAFRRQQLADAASIRSRELHIYL